MRRDRFDRAGTPTHSYVGEATLGKVANLRINSTKTKEMRIYVLARQIYNKILKTNMHIFIDPDNNKKHKCTYMYIY